MRPFFPRTTTRRDGQPRVLAAIELFGLLTFTSLLIGALVALAVWGAWFELVGRSTG
jgi:hypothetical protein